MKKLSLILVITAAFAAFSSAQFRGGLNMSGPGAENMLLRFDDVKTELKLTDDQKTKLGAAQSDMQSQGRQVFQDANGDREAMQAGFKKLMDSLNTTIAGILTDDQKKRLHELYIQKQGAQVLADPTVQKDLKLTEDQVKQIATLQKAAQDANQALFEKVQNGEIQREDVGTYVQKNNDVLKDKLDKVLTDDQRSKLKAMGGAPFTFDPKDNQMGFGRPRGGGGGGGN